MHCWLGSYLCRLFRNNVPQHWSEEGAYRKGPARFKKIITYLKIESSFNVLRSLRIGLICELQNLFFIFYTFIFNFKFFLSTWINKFLYKINYSYYDLFLLYKPVIVIYQPNFCLLKKSHKKSNFDGTNHVIIPQIFLYKLIEVEWTKNFQFSWLWYQQSQNLLIIPLIFLSYTDIPG